MTVTLEALDQGRELLTSSMRAAIDTLDDHTRLVALYHLGWCDEYGAPAQAHSGKAIRPALVFLACGAVGGRLEDGLPGAVAAELVHNFSLIHDDLMDRDTVRRHRSTVWAVWGDATAVLVGDAFASLAHEVLTSTGAGTGLRASRALARATRELIRGQVLDVAFESRDDVGLAECLSMATDKTGALLGVSAELGAILGGAPADVCLAYRTYGRELGLAFQLVDDVLGIWGDPADTGKPVYNDLRARKKTLPVVWAVECDGAPGRELAAWLRAPGPRSDAELVHAAGLLEAAGARDWAITTDGEREDRAQLALERADVPLAYRQQLDDLARFIVERQV